MYGYFFKYLLFLSVVFLLEGCPFGKSQNKTVDTAVSKKNIDIFFDDAQAFAKRQINASILLERFEAIEKDPKELSSLLAKEVVEEGDFKGYGILHLLARGAISAPVVQIFKELLLHEEKNAKKTLNKKAQGFTPFMLVRKSSLRPVGEEITENLALARLIIEYDRELINDASFSFSDRNYLLRSDRNRIIALFRALNTVNEQAWDNEAAKDPAAVKDILQPLMQLRAPQKRFYKNLLFSRAKGKALDHSDDQVLSLINEWQSYGFNTSDLLLDDFSLSSGPKGRILAVYAYALGDIRDTAPLLEKKFTDVVDALRNKLSGKDYDAYAHSDAVKGTLHDRTKSPGFEIHRENAIGSASAASIVLRLEYDKLFLLANKAVRKGRNNPKHRAYQNFSLAAQRLQRKLKANYVDQVTKVRHGRQAKTIDQLLKEALPDHPGEPEHLLNIKGEIDAALVFKACAANKVEAKVVKWLYEAAIANDEPKFKMELNTWLGDNALQHRKEFKRLFESGIAEQAQAMLKNSLVKTGLSYQKLVEEHEQFGLKPQDLRKDDWESSKDNQRKSTLLNAMAEKEQGRGLKSFVKTLSAKAFKGNLGSQKWLEYKEKKLDGKNATQHAAPGFAGDGLKEAARILLGQKKHPLLPQVPLPIAPLPPVPPAHAVEPPQNMNAPPGQALVGADAPNIAQPPVVNPLPQPPLARPQNIGQVAQNISLFQPARQPHNPQPDAIQQFHQAQLQQSLAAIPQNIVADTKNDLEKLKLLATKSWDELVQRNPDKALPELFVRTPINPQNAQPILRLVAMETKTVLQFLPTERQIDAKGQDLKKLLCGIQAQSAFMQSLATAKATLSQMDEQEWSFLASQHYFWSEVIDNIPEILNELNPEQIRWLSTAIANKNPMIAEKAKGTIHRLIAYLDIAEENLVEKRIAALIPAAQIGGASIEDRLLEKLAALKKNAATRRDQIAWHSFDARVQELQALAHERARRAQVLLQNDHKEAKALVTGLLSMNDVHSPDFLEHLNEFLPSQSNHKVGDALTMLSRNNEQLSDLLYALSDHQLHQIFAHLLKSEHKMTPNQGELLTNLLRGIKPDRPAFVPLLEQVLGALAYYNRYPAVQSDRSDLDRLLAMLQGSLYAALNRYDQKSVQHFDRSLKVALLEHFDFIKTRSAQWNLHFKNATNQQLLAQLREQEPQGIKLEGGFGLQGRKKNYALEDKAWISANETTSFIASSQSPLMTLNQPQVQKDARKYLAQFCTQAPFLSENKLREASAAFLATLAKHSKNTPVLDFIFELQHEQEVAVLAELLPNGLLVDLIKYLNVADNVPNSIFKQAQMLSASFFSYIPDAKALPLGKEPKFWELLGAQSAALGFALSKDMLAALTHELVLHNPITNEQNLARALAKIEIDQTSAEKVYEKLLAIALEAHGHGLTQIEKEISSKTNALLQNLTHDGPNRVRRLKDLL